MGSGRGLVPTVTYTGGWGGGAWWEGQRPKKKVCVPKLTSNFRPLS